MPHNPPRLFDATNYNTYYEGAKVFISFFRYFLLFTFSPYYFRFCILNNSMKTYNFKNLAILTILTFLTVLTILFKMLKLLELLKLQNRG